MIDLHVFSYIILYKSISTNMHTDTNETFRTERGEENVSAEVNQRGGSLYDVVRHIEGSLVGDALGEDGGLGDVKLQASILLEDMLELSQDLKRHAQVGLNVSIIRVCDCPTWNFARTRPRKWCIVKLKINISRGSPCCPPVLPFAK
jgi:hypothetical protein